MIHVYDGAGKVIETDGRAAGVYGSKNVTEMSLLSVFKGVEDNRYGIEGYRTEQP